MRTGIARVRRARLGAVMMIKQPGSRGLQRKNTGWEGIAEGSRGGNTAWPELVGKRANGDDSAC